MNKRSAKVAGADDLDIPPTPPEFFKRAVVGKYYAKLMADSNVVRIAPELRKAFPNERRVNDALRLLLELKEIAARKTRQRSA